MESIQELDCAVCMQKYNHPAKLPCDHVFCFLCVKGVLRRSHNCPMCRTPIPIDYLDNPVFVNETADDVDDCDDKYWWYYEGKDGWWSYDERSNDDLESDFNAGKSECKLLVAGAIYCVDFNTMIQYQVNDPRRKRKVKRDTLKHPSKGIAGIRKFSVTQNNNNNNNTMNTNNSDSSETTTVESNQENNTEVNDIETISQNLEVITLQEENSSNSDDGNT